MEVHPEGVKSFHTPDGRTDRQDNGETNSRFFEILLLDRFSKYPQISHFVKVHPEGVKSFHTPDGRTDKITAKLIVAFSKFC